MNTKRRLKKKNILVTGGLGFIGHHLVHRLIAIGDHPIIVDNFSVGRPTVLQGISKTHYTLLRVDIRDRLGLDAALRRVHFDVVIHLAAVHYLPYCVAHPQETMAVNVTGTKNLLAVVAKKMVRQFIFASSGAVYKPSPQLHRENDPLGPIDIYGQSKVLAEQLVSTASKQNSWWHTILRLANVYGPEEQTPHFIPSLVSQLHTNNSLTVGNIKTKRDYIFIDDVVDAMIRVIRSPQGPQKIYNIGTGVITSGKFLIQREVPAC